MKLTTLLLSSAIAALGLGPLIQPPPAALAPGLPPPTADLRQFMEKELNSALTDASYQLFHVRKPGAEPAPELLEALDRLSEKSSQLARHPMSQGEAGASFRIYAVQLQIAVRGLADASMSEDDTQQRLWMTHVTSVCNSCHAEYRE